MYPSLHVSTSPHKSYISICLSHIGKCLRGNSGPPSTISLLPSCSRRMSNTIGQLRFNELHFPSGQGYCPKGIQPFFHFPLPSRLQCHTFSFSFLHSCHAGQDPSQGTNSPFYFSLSSTPLLTFMVDAGKSKVLFHKVMSLESTSHAIFLMICSSLQVITFKYRVASRRYHLAQVLSHKLLQSLLGPLGLMTTECYTTIR